MFAYIKELISIWTAGVTDYGRFAEAPVVVSIPAILTRESETNPSLEGGAR